MIRFLPICQLPLSSIALSNAFLEENLTKEVPFDLPSGLVSILTLVILPHALKKSRISPSQALKDSPRTQTSYYPYYYSSFCYISTFFPFLPLSRLSVDGFLGVLPGFLTGSYSDSYYDYSTSIDLGTGFFPALTEESRDPFLKGFFTYSSESLSSDDYCCITTFFLLRTLTSLEPFLFFRTGQGSESEDSTIGFCLPFLDGTTTGGVSDYYEDDDYEEEDSTIGFCLPFLDGTTTRRQSDYYEDDDYESEDSTIGFCLPFLDGTTTGGVSDYYEDDDYESEDSTIGFCLNGTSTDEESDYYEDDDQEDSWTGFFRIDFLFLADFLGGAMIQSSEDSQDSGSCFIAFFALSFSAFFDFLGWESPDSLCRGSAFLATLPPIDATLICSLFMPFFTFLSVNGVYSFNSVSGLEMAFFFFALMGATAFFLEAVRLATSQRGLLQSLSEAQQIMHAVLRQWSASCACPQSVVEIQLILNCYFHQNFNILQQTPINQRISILFHSFSISCYIPGTQSSN